MNKSVFFVPRYVWYQFIDPGRVEGMVGVGVF